MTLGLGIGLAMLKLTDPDTIPDGLLGTVLSMLIRTLQSDLGARELLAGFGETHTKQRSTATAQRSQA